MQCPSPSIIDWISCFFTICSALCSSLSVSINPICWLRGWVGCPCICTFTAFYDGIHVKLHFEAFVHLQPFAYIRVSCYAFVCLCQYVVAATFVCILCLHSSQHPSVCVHLFCRQMLVSLYINLPVAETVSFSMSGRVYMCHARLSAIAPAHCRSW